MAETTTGADRSAEPRPDTLAALQAQAHERLIACARLIETGVLITDPATTYVAAGVEIGAGTEIKPRYKYRQDDQSDRQVEGDYGVRQLHVHGHAAHHNLHDDQQDSRRGACHDEAIIAVPKPGRDRRAQDYQPYARRG